MEGVVTAEAERAAVEKVIQFSDFCKQEICQ